MNSHQVKDTAREIYHWLRHPGSSLSQRVVHGGFWSFALRIVNRGFGLVRTIVLARLLAPADFGLFGIAMLALSSLRSFSKTGFDQALIQKKEETESYLNTAWSVQVVRGFALGGILVAGAPLVGAFFGEPRAVFLVRVLGVAELIKNLRNIGVVYFKKELEFHKQFAYEFSGTFADLAVALPAAFILRSVWALVFGLLARNTVQVLLSYGIHRFRPRLRFDKGKALELIDFGRWVLGSSIVVFLATQGDDIFLGKVLGAGALGLYQLAYRISNVTTTEITHVIGHVTLPSYSKLQDDADRLKEAFSKVLNAVMALTIPITVGVFILAPDFVQVFLGSKWAPMIPALRILSVAGFLRATSATGGPLFRAVGKPKYDFTMNLIRVLLIAATIYPLTVNFGIAGTSISVIIGLSGTIPVWWYRSLKITEISLKGTVGDLAPIVLAGLLMGGVVQGTRLLVGSGAWRFFGTVSAGVIFYLAFSLLLWKKFHVGPFRTIHFLREAV